MSTVAKPFTFSTGATIIASEHNSNFDTIYNDYNGNITNVNVAANAAIEESKLDLSTISQTITSIDVTGGTIDGTIIGGTTPAAGTFSTLNLGSTNQGDILYDNGTSIVRLTPGTSGEVLTTQGAAANPVWGGGTKSNVIFAWSGTEVFLASGSGYGLANATTLTGTDTEIVGYVYFISESTSFQTILKSRFTKISGIDTVTIHARLWAANVGATVEAVLQVDIGGQTNTVKSVTSTTPSWVTTSDVDVSGLVDGTTYDLDIGLSNETNNATGYCSAVTLIGS